MSVIPQWHPDIPKDATLTACLWAAWEYPTDPTPLRIVADRLEDLDCTDRAAWIRTACDLWDEAEALQPGEALCNYDECYEALRWYGVADDAKAWRTAVLWGALLSACAPTGNGTGRMYQTWTDARVFAVHHWTWLWACGLIDARQTDAIANWATVVAPYVTYMSLRQEYAASLQASAISRQADAATRQFFAAEQLAFSLMHQADAAACQVDPGPDMPSELCATARHACQRVHRYARTLWELILLEV